MIIQLRYNPRNDARPVRLPLSKSIALRVMTLNALSRRLGGGEAMIPQLPDAGDVAGMERALRCYADGGGEVYIGEGGAPLRFFTALAASTPGIDVKVTASEALMRRPLKPLLDALHDAGASVRCSGRTGYPPLRIKGRKLDPAHVAITPAVSSQFVSALMMASPLWERGLNLEFTGGKPVSAPYILMTARIMSRFGISTGIGQQSVTVEPVPVRAPRRFDIETDWSAASYFYELALLLPGTPVPLERLTPPDDSLQGDSRCADIFGRLGVTTTLHPDGSATLLCDPGRLDAFLAQEEPMELDMGDTPDLVPALAVALCMAGVRFRFTGIAHLHHKESDRIHALAVELGRIGFGIEAGADFMAWEGARTPTGEDETISSYSDHRMAMAFAPAAARLPYLCIADPEVVEKSYPAYWEALRALGFEITAFGATSGSALTI